MSNCHGELTWPIGARGIIILIDQLPTFWCFRCLLVLAAPMGLLALDHLYIQRTYHRHVFMLRYGTEWPVSRPAILVGVPMTHARTCMSLRSDHTWIWSCEYYNVAWDGFSAAWPPRRASVHPYKDMVVRIFAGSDGGWAFKPPGLLTEPGQHPYMDMACVGF